MEEMIHAKQNEGVELYYDNSKKFETTSEWCKWLPADVAASGVSIATLTGLDH